MHKAVPALLLLCAFPLLAQTPYLVKDINTTYSFFTKSSKPAEFASFNGRIYFAATTDAAGTELWSTDGTSSGTAMVADIIPGTGSSSPSSFRVVNGTLLFNARDVDHGVELWTTDGTAAGTHMLVDISPGPTGSQPVAKTLYKNRMLFSADDGTNGRELWITDGTAAGTHLVKDIVPGSGSSNPSYFVPFGDSVYFAAGSALWKTDGTEAGTVQVAPVPAFNLRVAGSQLFFVGYTPAAGLELWVSDGTAAGTRMVTDINPGTASAFDTNVTFPGLAAIGNRVLFAATDGVHGRELWVSDGTAAGTQLVRDFVPGSKGLFDGAPLSIAVLGDRAFFAASDDAHGWELWVTDGTDAGTHLFADLTPGPTSSYPTGLTVSGGKLFFGVGNGAVGPALWVTDGTAAGTMQIGAAQSLGLGLNTAVAFWPNDGKLYFAGATPITGQEPWVTDGTDAGTHMIANLAPDVAPSSSPGDLTASGNLIFFYAFDGSLPGSLLYDTSLWRSDGTDAGTFRLMDSGQHPDTLMAAGPYVLFYDQINSKNLLISDGTTAGTGPAKGFLARFGPSTVDAFFPFGDTLFASVNDLGPYEDSLWITTAAPNAPAIRLGSVNPSGLIDLAGKKFFYAEWRPLTREYGLWTADGTRAGTYPIVPDLGNSDTPSALVAAAGTLFFAYQSQKGSLWKSDGTFDGTVALKDVSLPVYGRCRLTAAGRRVFFVSADDMLWTSDGTTAGTVPLAKATFDYSETPDDMKAVGDGRVVWGQFDTTANTYELWTSDGTPAGTKVLMNLGQHKPYLTAIDGVAWFAGTDDLHGTELWSTDGTAEGTKLVADVNPGPASSNPVEFTKMGNTLYFSAFTDATGAELWALPLAGSTLSIADARVTEGDSGTVHAHFTVSLTPAAAQSVTVAYATTDGTATAGQDYDATSGTLTFAPGETSKTIDVVVHGDTIPEGNENFFVTLSGAAGARVVRAQGAGIIEDDDQFADLAVATQFGDTSIMSESVLVSSSGPRAATEVTVTVTSTPPYLRSGCTVCSIAEIPVGASATTASDYSWPATQTYLSAIVTARQRDPRPSNNTTSWTVSAERRMAMDAAYLTVGSFATITATTAQPTPGAVSSDPTVASISFAPPKTGNLAKFTVTGLKAGTTSITVDGVFQPLTVIVVAPGTTPRWPGGVTMTYDSQVFRFDQPMHVTVTPAGTAPVSGATATGTVVVTAGGQEVARQTLNGTKVAFPAYFPSTGSIAYQIAYSGDASFAPSSVTGSVFVNPGHATILPLVDASAAGTVALTIAVNGSPAAAPTGSVAISGGGIPLTTVPLVASGGGTSTAHATLNVSAPATLTVNYSGDARYAAGAQQLRVAPRHRATHH